VYGTCGGGVQAPFGSVLALYGWAADNWNRLDGILIYRTGKGIGGLTGPELVNVTYAHLTDGRDLKQVAEFDMQLAPPEKKTEMIDKQNMEAMRQLQAMMPPPGRPGV